MPEKPVAADAVTGFFYRSGPKKEIKGKSQSPLTEVRDLEGNL